MRGVEGGIAARFEAHDLGVKLAAGDFFGGCGDVAELAGGKVAFRCAHRRSEGAADDGAMLIEIAGAGGGVEDGAGFVVAEVGEEWGVFVVGCEDSGGEVAGEVWIDAGEECGDAAADAIGAGGIGLGEGGETFVETRGVLLRDGEDAMTALGAAGLAGEVRAAAAGGVGEGGVDDLD